MRADADAEAGRERVRIGDRAGNEGVVSQRYVVSRAQILEEARRSLRPAFALAAALEHAAANPRLGALLDLADLLDVTGQSDPASDESKLADRVRAAVAQLDRVFGQIVEARHTRS